MKEFKVAVVGATGAVGVEIVNVMHAHKFPLVSSGDYSVPIMYASARSAGKLVDTPYGSLTIREFELSSVQECEYDVIFLAVSGTFSKQYARELAKGNALVIDNSSALRMEEDVPLVVPEINSNSVYDGCKLIANPNCTTAIAVMALWPLHCKFNIRKIIMSTYQVRKFYASSLSISILKCVCTTV